VNRLRAGEPPGLTPTTPSAYPIILMAADYDGMSPRAKIDVGCYTDGGKVPSVNLRSVNRGSYFPGDVATASLFGIARPNVLGL